MANKAIKWWFQVAFLPFRFAPFFGKNAT